MVGVWYVIIGGLILMALVVAVVIAAYPAVILSTLVVSASSPESFWLTAAAYVAALAIVAAGIVVIVRWRRAIPKAFTNDTDERAAGVIAYSVAAYLLMAGVDSVIHLVAGPPEYPNPGAPTWATLAGLIVLVPLAVAGWRSWRARA